VGIDVKEYSEALGLIQRAYCIIAASPKRLAIFNKHQSNRIAAESDTVIEAEEDEYEDVDRSGSCRMKKLQTQSET
jgi:hypothetical protein